MTDVVITGTAGTSTHSAYQVRSRNVGYALAALGMTPSGNPKIRGDGRAYPEPVVVTVELWDASGISAAANAAYELIADAEAATQITWHGGSLDVDGLMQYQVRQSGPAVEVTLIFAPAGQIAPGIATGASSYYSTPSSGDWATTFVSTVPDSSYGNGAALYGWSFSVSEHILATALRGLVANTRYDNNYLFLTLWDQREPSSPVRYDFADISAGSGNTWWEVPIYPIVLEPGVEYVVAMVQATAETLDDSSLASTIHAGADDADATYRAEVTFGEDREATPGVIEYPDTVASLVTSFVAFVDFSYEKIGDLDL